MSTLAPEANISFYPSSGPFAAAMPPISITEEYSVVAVSLDYVGPPLQFVYLYVGGVYVAGPFELRANMRSFAYPVEDYVGVLRWELRQQATVIAAAELEVLPRK